MKWIPILLFFASIPACLLIPIRIVFERLLYCYWPLALASALWSLRDVYLAVEWFRGNYPAAWHGIYDNQGVGAGFLLLDIALTLGCFHQLVRRSREVYPWGSALIVVFAAVATGGALATLTPGTGLFSSAYLLVRYSHAFCGAFLLLALFFFLSEFSTIAVASAAAFDQAVIATTYFIGTFMANTLSSMDGIAERVIGANLLGLVCLGCFTAWTLLITQERDATSREASLKTRAAGAGR